MVVFHFQFDLFRTKGAHRAFVPNPLSDLERVHQQSICRIAQTLMALEKYLGDLAKEENKWGLSMIFLRNVF